MATFGYQSTWWFRFTTHGLSLGLQHMVDNDNGHQMEGNVDRMNVENVPSLPLLVLKNIPKKRNKLAITLH